MLWGGRFDKKLDKKAMSFSSSLNFDKILIFEDIEGSIAHAEMLRSVGLISQEETDKITEGLSRIKDEFKGGSWNPSEEEFEDIHSAVEYRLKELTGETAGKLHTGRSRNDQVATDMRLWIKKAATGLKGKNRELQKRLVETASENVNTLMPGYTHLQRAQPISFAFHLLAYVEMLERDVNRLDFVYYESDLLPLGSGALAGSTLPLARELIVSKLGFSGITANALDAISDRDFLLDFLNAVNLGMMHLSRLAEEIVLWSSAEWKFVLLSDEYTTGSSLMPQKKNPDMAELIRGKVGRVYGNYTTLATTLKALPLSYNRDLQEDKEPVFDSFNTYYTSIGIMESMIATMKINKDRFVEELKHDFILATDLADWLVLKGVPFRESHSIVGKVVSYCEKANKYFIDLSIDELKKIDERFDETALECFDINTSLERKKTFGSPNPEMVKEQIAGWKSKLF